MPDPSVPAAARLHAEPVGPDQARVARQGLVPADVERAYHHRLVAESGDDLLVRAVLLLLVRHRRAADDEKLRAHQAYTFRA